VSSTSRYDDGLSGSGFGIERALRASRMSPSVSGKLTRHSNVPTKSSRDPTPTMVGSALRRLLCPAGWRSSMWRTMYGARYPCCGCGRELFSLPPSKMKRGIIPVMDVIYRYLHARGTSGITGSRRVCCACISQEPGDGPGVLTWQWSYGYAFQTGQ
jgi:hypothetical protein